MLAGCGVSAAAWAVFAAVEHRGTDPMLPLRPESAPADRGGIASGVINAARQAGGVLGVAILGSLVSVPAAFIGGLRAGLVVAGCAFLAGAALVAAARSGGAPARS